jgi:hypothetical protein
MGVTMHDSAHLQPKSTVHLPTHIRNTPIVIQDVRMSKLHTAIVTTDPVSNLYMCGHGPGGRLGTGSETTRHHFTCIEGGGLGQKKVAAVALGQNHTLAITECIWPARLRPAEADSEGRRSHLDHSSSDLRTSETRYCHGHRRFTYSLCRTHCNVSIYFRQE